MPFIITVGLLGFVAGGLAVHNAMCRAKDKAEIAERDERIARLEAEKLYDKMKEE